MPDIVRRAVGGAVGLTAVATVNLAAQTAKQCDAAARVVSSGTVRANQRDAYFTLRRCGSVGANAFAAGIAKQATVTDTIRLEDFMTAADSWRDESVYSAASHLAVNTSATAQSRVYAIRHLIGLVETRTRYDYGGLVAGTDTTIADGTREVSVACAGAGGSEPYGSVVVTPLPSDVANQIRTTLASLVASPSAPKQVRAAAACLAQ